ncbi:Transposon Tn10 TetD protein [compost metagenome]
MDTLRILSEAIDYIEERLESEIKLEEIAKVTLFSKYHFQRMFHALTGFTVTQYIRNRRLTLAAEELAGTDCKVIDAALKYGYDSPEAFAKAFTRLHGVTPSAAKKRDVKLKAFPRISFQIQIKGESEMNYRIVEEKGYTVIGKDVLIRSEAYNEIPGFVEEIWKNGTCDQINEATGRQQGSLLYGYYFDFNEDGTKRYMMGCELPEGNPIPSGFTVLNIPSQTYAVFESAEAITEGVGIGPKVQNIWHRIYSEWFPTVNFEQVEGACLEKYYWLDERQTDTKCEVWIPIKEKR